MEDVYDPINMTRDMAVDMFYVTIYNAGELYDELRYVQFVSIWT